MCGESGCCRGQATPAEVVRAHAGALEDLASALEAGEETRRLRAVVLELRELAGRPALGEAAAALRGDQR